jgi:hypothetical protein
MTKIESVSNLCTTIETRTYVVEIGLGVLSRMTYSGCFEAAGLGKIASHEVCLIAWRMICRTGGTSDAPGTSFPRARGKGGGRMEDRWASWLRLTGTERRGKCTLTLASTGQAHHVTKAPF